MLKTTLQFFVSAVWVMFITAPVNAQDMYQYYTVSHPDQFDIDWGSFYNSINEHTARVRDEYPHHLDLAYGTGPKQRLDVYMPKEKVSNAPVFLFVHGGGFREGDRTHYGSVAEPFVKRGVITVTPSYRLTGSGAHYPDQPDDIKSAVKWIFDNIQQYGGDPENIYVAGHSAGAVLTADIGVDRAWLTEMGMPKDMLKAIMPISGPYDIRVKRRPGQLDAYAPTPEIRVQSSPILKINDPAPAALVATGSEEEYVQPSLDFANALKAAGVDAHYLLLEGEDHADTALLLADENSRLCKRVISMILGSE